MQGLLIFPAALFMSALVVRNLPVPRYELARNAQRIVMPWYSARQWTLWILLIVLPLCVSIVGCLTLLSPSTRALNGRRPRGKPSPRSARASLFVAAATLMAGGFPAIVVVHMLAN